MTLRWDCQTKGCYKTLVLPDWGFLAGCFPRRSKPTDIDGMVHLRADDGRDRFLFLEKKGPHGFGDEGQRQAFLALSRQPGTQVLCLRGQDHEIDQMIWYPNPEGWQYADQELVRKFCWEWGQGGTPTTTS
jgi:hypothetical protein